MKTAFALALLPVLALAGEEPFQQQAPLQAFDFHVASTVSHNATSITTLLASVDVAEVEKQALALANDFTTRQSQSTGLYQAVDYVAKLLSDYGFETETPDFRAGWAPNVIGTIRGTRFPDEIVILGTHLDDRNTNSASTTTRAPGANDDGSGSAALLATAKVIYCPLPTSLSLSLSLSRAHALSLYPPPPPPYLLLFLTSFNRNLPIFRPTFTSFPALLPFLPLRYSFSTLLHFFSTLPPFLFPTLKGHCRQWRDI
jgi:hypothetical protein